MVILVTGAAGFIGSHLVDKLLSLGHKVIGLDNLSNGCRENIKEALGNPGFSFICGDLIITETANKIIRDNKPDAIFHLAARGSVPASISDPQATFANNVYATHELLLQAIRGGVKMFVNASSSSVYGENGGTKRIESDELRPLNPYGLSKAMIEKYCDMFYKLYRMPTVSFRFFNVYGPRQKANSQNAAVIPSFISGMLERGEISINGSGSNVRDFTFVGDVVDALVATIDSEPNLWAGKSFNVCNGKGTSINDLAIKIQELTKLKEIMINRRSQRAGDISYSIGSNIKIQSFLGIKPGKDLDLGLKETVEYYRGFYGARGL